VRSFLTFTYFVLFVDTNSCSSLYVNFLLPVTCSHMPETAFATCLLWRSQF
jgi:hypothetical protein